MNKNTSFICPSLMKSRQLQVGMGESVRGDCLFPPKKMSEADISGEAADK